MKREKKMKKIFGMPIALAIIGMLILGGATAALLSVYVTINDTADVEQSVTWKGNDVENKEFSFSSKVAGSSLIDVYTLENNAPIEAKYEFETKCDDRDFISNNARVTTSHDINWGGQCEGITTRYVEYFDDAGHKFPSLDDFACDVNVTAGDVIQDAIDDGNDVICVEKAGSPYDGFVVDRDGVTVVSNGAKINTSRVNIKADNTTIEGFEITGLNDYGIHNYNGDNILIKNNHIHDNKHGMYAQGDSCSGLVIEHNTFKNNGVGIGGTENMDGEIKYNIFKNHNIEAIGVGDEQTFTTEGNIFKNNAVSFRIYYNNSDYDVDAEDNYFASGLNIDMNGNEDTEVNADYKTKTDTTLAPDEEDKFAIINKFAINLAPGQYTLESNILPVE
ncbi:MAG: right-handed parallel beta-helix repeat-containing protein [Candidatus Woesearchaeota archaeon]